MADVFQTPIAVTNSKEGPALGVALLAGIGTGVYKNAAEACDAAIKVVKVQNPIEDNIPVYEKYYEVYGGLYYALKDSYQKLADISR